MSKLQKLSYTIGIGGLGLLFAGIKMPLLAFGGLAAVLSAIVVYSADRYLCSSADVIVPEMDIPAPDEEKLPEALGNAQRRDMDRKEVVRPNVPDREKPKSITYRYDVVMDPVDQVPAVIGIVKQINNYTANPKQGR